MIESAVYPSTTHDYSPMSMARSNIRSSPIAIVQSKATKEDEFDHSDSDESIIDVELDALKIRQKQQTPYDSKPPKGSISLKDEKQLKAPYLGSLSKSDENLLSLPPIALSDPYLEDPPSEVVSYGSLRDSQQKGLFIDGPMSYREPSSGRIMQYDRLKKYQSVPPTRSIGERMQQALKLKELKQKQEEQKQNGENSSSSNVSSSLSAIMKDASTQMPKTTSFVDQSQANTDTFMPTFGFYDTEHQNDPHMLSTSLTAFEILQTKLEPPSRLVISLNNDVLYEGGFKPLARSMSDPLPKHYRPDGSAVFSPMLPPQAAAQATPSMSHFSLGPSPMAVHGRGGQVDTRVSFNHDDSPDMDAAFAMDL